MSHYEPMLNTGYPDDAEIARLKTPPYSLQAEQAVIGGLLIGGNNLDQIAELITENDFFRSEHRAAFREIVRLSELNQPHDLITVCDALSARGDLDRAGGFEYLVGINRDTPSAANIRAYANAVRERATLRNLITTAQSITDSAFSPEGRTATELLDDAQSAILALGEQTAEAGDLHISARMKNLVDEWQRRSDADGVIGVSTGFRDLDARTNGLNPGDLIILAARPSMGKTSLAMNMAEHIAVDEGKAVLVFSMEMTTEQILDRMTASVGKIPFELLRTGKVFATEHDSKVIPTAQKIKSAPLYVDDRAALTVQQMRTTARRLHKKTPLSLIVVDYLQLARAKAESRVMEVTQISQGLKALAKELRVPVLALSQLSRSVEQRTNKRPVNSDLRDSGAIEQDADVIWFIYRDEVYNEDSPDKGIAEIHCTKQRNGPIGVDRIASNLSRCRFDTLTTEYQPRQPEPSNRRNGGFDY